ncbi:hypothetical protein ACLOJK_027284 [Asimina triloba]
MNQHLPPATSLPSSIQARSHRGQRPSRPAGGREQLTPNPDPITAAGAPETQPKSDSLTNPDAHRADPVTNKKQTQIARDHSLHPHQSGLARSQQLERKIRIVRQNNQPTDECETVSSRRSQDPYFFAYGFHEITKLKTGGPCVLKRKHPSARSSVFGAVVGEAYENYVELTSLVDQFHSQEVDQNSADKFQGEIEEGDAESAEIELEGHNKGKEMHYEDFDKQKLDQNEDSSEQMLEKEVADETKAQTDAKFDNQMEKAEKVEKNYQSHAYLDNVI